MAPEDGATDKLRLAALYEVGSAIACSLNQRELLDRILEVACEVMGARICTLRLLDEATKELRLAANRGMGRYSKPLKVGDSIVGRAVQERRAYAVTDISQSPYKNSDLARRMGLKSLLSVPMVVRDFCVGGLTVYSVGGREYDEGDVRLLTALASQAAVAIQNAQLFRETVNILVSLARAVEAQDPYTRGHSARVTAYAANLAQKVRLPSRELAMIKQLGPMHDIGKVGVDEAIIRKPAPLSPVERAVMERHPAIGENIVRPITAFQPGIFIIRSHHERYDGKGYPDGLAGEEIPLCARILAIADSFDAMTSKRPYRDPMSSEAACSEIEANAGTQFDPELVPLFIEALKEEETPD